ncbi:NADH dehydrogenase FAD-containing subunit, partial [Enterococcus lactis]
RELFKPSTWFGEGSWFTGNSVFPCTWDYNVTDVACGASAAGVATTADSGAGASAGEAATDAAHFGFSYGYGEEPMAVIEKSPHCVTKIMQVNMPINHVA